MNVTADMLGDVQQDIYKAYRFSNGQKDEKPNKLILNDMGKQDYVTLVFETGIQKYEDKVEKRKDASRDFEKGVYKIMSHAVYEKRCNM